MDFVLDDIIFNLKFLPDTSRHFDGFIKINKHPSLMSKTLNLLGLKVIKRHFKLSFLQKKNYTYQMSKGLPRKLLTVRFSESICKLLVISYNLVIIFL
jgi:hypothetical protein